MRVLLALQLLKFMQSNKSKFFVAEYEVPTEEYLKAALSADA